MANDRFIQTKDDREIVEVNPFTGHNLTCCLCEQQFCSARVPGDAEKEREEIFGGPIEEEDKVCCDDCWQTKVLPNLAKMRAEGLIP